MALTLSKFKLALSNAINRLITAKLAETISVLDFGAVGDGVTDDTTALQNALNSSVGTRLLVPAGTYLTGTLTVPSNTYLLLAPGATIKLKASVNTHLLKTATSSRESNITIEGGCLDGNRDNQTSGNTGRCINFIDVTTVKLINLEVKQASDHGAFISTGPATDPLEDTQGVWATGCIFHHNGTDPTTGNGGTGLACNGSYFWVTDCYSYSNTLAGFKIVGQYATFKGCYAFSNDNAGFGTGFDPAVEGKVHTYTDCYAIGNGISADPDYAGDGFRHSGQVDHIIHQNCFAIGNGWSGFAFTASLTVKPTNITVNGGEARNNGFNVGTPSSVRDGSGIFLGSSTSTPNVPSAITISNILITDDQSVKTQKYAVQALFGDDIFIGEGCRLTGNLNSSIWCNAAQVSAVKLSNKIVTADFLYANRTAATHTGDTTETVLMTHTIPGRTLSTGQRYRVQARGTCSGTNGTKQFRFYFGSANVLFSSQAAGDTEQWFLDATVEVTGTSSQQVRVTGVEVGGANVYSILASSSSVASDIIVKVTGALGNAADTVTCNSLYFDPL